ncbi:MAG: glycosyltransferase family 4 protein [Magnetococcales bacterium]|nr:glycosyltransferase family 4 protein [Magnetococcales bacterium]MBF0348637.1 glycosyltransferase family 4 protein [Magnetococcales bacterium]
MNIPSFLRILHTESSLGWGGQEIRLLSESRAMIERGHEVRLLCPPDSRIRTAADRYQIPVTIAPMGRKNLTGLLAVRSWLAAHPADVVVTHSSTDSWLVALASQTLSRPAPIVRLRHVSTAVPDNPPTRWLYTRACRHIVTTGQAIRTRLIEVNRYPEAQITSIPTGIDLDRFSPGDRHAARSALGLPDDGPVIGIVATLRSWKGHSFLLEAFKEIVDTSRELPLPRLVVVGDGPQEENLHRQAGELNLRQRVHFSGYQTDPVPWLHALDLFALPSHGNEGVPQALMQAMACGLPVVSTPVGAIPEIIVNEENGLLVRPKDSPSLANAIKRLLHEPMLGERLAQAALRTARERFGMEPMVREMETLLTRIARGI